MTKNVFHLLMLALPLTACTSIDCPVQNTVSTVYHIYDTAGNRVSLADMLSVSTTRRDGTDSVLLNRSTNTGEFSIPISYNDPEDTLYLEISRMVSAATDNGGSNDDGNDGTSGEDEEGGETGDGDTTGGDNGNDYSEVVLVRDTIWVAKDNYPHFESVDCNASFFHNITAVRCTHNIIDSIAINNKSVTYDASKEHFHLYLKVQH